MADAQQADPVQARLITAPVSNDVRADAWDAFQQAKDPDDLAKRLAMIKIPDNVKADLWDMKNGKAPAEATKGTVLGRVAAALPQSTDEAVRDFGMGALKQTGRLVQMIPGVATATDKLYGLPPGASKQSMQPSNLSERLGGYGADVAETLATGGAEAGPAIASRGIGYVSNPTVAQRVGVIAEPTIAKLGDVAKFTGDVGSILKANLSVGPLTADKVAGLITKYGKDAVKLAVAGTLGAGALKAFNYLLK